MDMNTTQWNGSPLGPNNSGKIQKTDFEPPPKKSRCDSTQESAIGGSVFEGPSFCAAQQAALVSSVPHQSLIIFKEAMALKA